MRVATCATAVPSGIRSLAHVAAAKDRNGLRAAIMSSQLSAAYVSVISWLEWVANCAKTLPPMSWVSCGSKESIAFNFVIDLQVPKPCPFGDSCPSVGPS